MKLKSKDFRVREGGEVNLKNGRRASIRVPVEEAISGTLERTRFRD
jgi:hypothetical protein